MNLGELAELRYETGYVFENGTVFYEPLGDERAAGLLKALQVNGCRIARKRASARQGDHVCLRKAGPASRTHGRGREGTHRRWPADDRMTRRKARHE